MNKLKKHCIDSLKKQPSDALALGVVNFADHSFEAFQLEKSNGEVIEGPADIYFDLASLSKPLTNSIGAFSAPELISDEMKLLLNHRSGLPSWGLLPKNNWQEQLESYPIKESETIYSDFGALRFMLEFNRSGKNLHMVGQEIWDSEVLFWKDLNIDHRLLQYGFVDKRANYGMVHDPNALNLNDMTSHAGLFGTVSGVCKTLINFDQKLGLLDRMNSELSGPHDRFVLGWDTVTDPSNTLAGNGCGKRVFGHLGFTGTSIWIDPVKKLGHVLLCNATKMHWFDKTELNKLRRSLGEFIWEKF